MCRYLNLVLILLILGHNVENFSSPSYYSTSWFPWQHLWSDQHFNHPEDFSGIFSIPATYHGFDEHTEIYEDNRMTGNDFMDQHFYLCYHRDGTKTYYKKQDPRQFQNRRYWIISATNGFVGSMELC